MSAARFTPMPQSDLFGGADPLVRGRRPRRPAYTLQHLRQKVCGITRFALLLAVPALFAQAPVRFDSGPISGLPARNIGSAAMSGRIAALAAVNDGGRLTVFAASASGGVWKSVNADRESTRLNSSHLGISYAVFCLKKRKQQ